MKNKKNNYERQFWNNFNDYIYYWRSNPHRFIEEYLGIQLKFFQKILIFLMAAPYTTKLNSFIFFASRGLGKTFLSAIYCAATCILYPGIKVIVSSANTDQAKQLVTKILEIRDKFPMLSNEIKDKNDRKGYARIIWKNGSVLESCTSGDGARGNRCQILVLDEARLMFKEDILNNLTPFLTGRRKPAYLKLDKKYEKYLEKEHNSLLFLTSIGYKNDWLYRDFEDYCKYIANGDDNYGVMSIPYQVGVETDIITSDFIETQLRNSSSNLKSFKMEMEVIPYGETENALFDYTQLAKLRKLHQSLIPITDSEFTIHNGDITKSVYYTQKQPGEIRVLSFDIAYATGRRNDNSVITVFRLMENGDYYMKYVSFMEVMNGTTIDNQAIRAKQVFYNLECDYAVVDAGGPGGIAMIGILGQKTFDPVRGVRYPGWRTYNADQKFDGYVGDILAEPVMYCIQANNNASTNMQYTLKTLMDVELERNHIMFLINEKEVQDTLNEKYEYLRLSTSNNYNDREKANMIIQSFANTTMMIDEAIQTKLVKNQSGRYIMEEGTGRKDRIISVLYGIYFIVMFLEKDLDYNRKKVNIQDYFSNTNLSSGKPQINNPFGSNLDKLQNFGRRR